MNPEPLIELFNGIADYLEWDMENAGYSQEMKRMCQVSIDTWRHAARIVASEFEFTR